MAIAPHLTNVPALPTDDRGSSRLPDLEHRELSDINISLPSLSDIKEDETFFMLSAIARLGPLTALNERVIIDSILLNRYVATEIRDIGYRPTSADPQVLEHPSTRNEGWIMELSEGKSLWGSSYIAAGNIEGRVSKDLFYAVEQSKAHISDKFFNLFKHPGLRSYDELAIRNTEPFRSLFKEIKTFSDAQKFIRDHSVDLPEIKSGLPVYWNRPTNLTFLASE